MDALTGINEKRPDWQLLLDSKEKFDLIMSDAKVPDKERGIIWDALQSTQPQLDAKLESGNTLRETMKKVLVMPTLEEWRTACKNASGGKASSMSGLTYDIVKGWPPEVVDRTYECIAGIKKAGEHPKHWAYKWLAPMPKKTGDDISVNDLRPLTLIEVTRKLWTSVTVRKIWHVIKKHNLLHPSQHGYRRRRGTSSQSLQLIDVFEECEEAAADLGLSSWDTVKAFDSISRALAKISLYRMGVPKEVCEDIIDIDEGGSTFIRCPLARKIWQRRIHNIATGTSYTDMDTSAAPPFEALRGVPQGDIPSPLCWDLFEDIVLCALDAINWGDILVRDGHGELRKALNKCYADDLLILAAKREALQQKADIMSAIAIIFKMKINTTKLRLFLLEHGDEHEPTQDPTLLLHVDDWEEGSIVEKEILRTEKMKS